jgi:cobalt/nickel transport system permease protein
VIQALVFQDGGVLALGANIVNMALLGVVAGYLPASLWGGTRWRRASLFAGGFLSVLVSGTLALSELLLSGVPMGSRMVAVSLAVFLVSAVLEGAITLAIVESLEKIQPRLVRPLSSARSPVLGVVATGAVMLASIGVLFASQSPDAIQQLTHQSAGAAPGWLMKSVSGLAGIALIYGACLVFARVAARNRSV